MRSLGVCLVGLGLTLARPPMLTAQSLEGSPVPCKGQIVSRIEIHTRPPFEISGSKLHQRLARRVTQLHATTNPDIIRRFLALAPGDVCTELRRSESERILRAQPYLREAKVLAFPDENGTVSVSVQTVDEVSLLVGAGGSAKSPFLTRTRVGESNLMGEAVSLDGEWRHSRDFRDMIAVRLTDYQLFGRPYQFHLEGAQRELGHDWGVEASQPFLTDLQRDSWRITGGTRVGFQRFQRLDGTSVYMPLNRGYGDLGGVIRVGTPGRIALVGASLSYAREDPGTTPLLREPHRPLISAPGLFPSGLYQPHHAVRVNALFGIRHVTFVQVSGFESLDGFQDVRRGVEIATLVGQGIEALGGDEHDMFVSTDAYGGVGSQRAFAGIDVRAEGRRPEAKGDWDGLLASGRAAAYLKSIPHNTVVADAEWSAGWRQRIPFQLALADRQGGPLGYGGSYLAGGRRLVTRLEDRILLGRVKQVASLGIAPFVNTGELWAGDAPFGSTTGVKYSAGVSLLASVPPRSKRMWRLDLAFPIHPEFGAKWQLRLTSQALTRTFWKEPTDVARNREQAIPASIFNWP